MIPAFSIIIVNYNAGDYLARTVETLAAQSFTDFEAFIVDNGSTDGSLDGLTLDARFTLMEAGENLGFAAGNNLAALQARAPWIITLNPDAFPRPDWLAQIARAIPRHPGATMFGSMQIMAEDPELWDGTGDELSVFGVAYRAGHGRPVRTLTEDFPVFGPCAAAAIYQRDAFKAVGGFNERFFCYHEDVELALKLRRAGGRAVQLVDAVVDHVGGGTSGGASDFAVYHGTRNRIWTWFGAMPVVPMILLLPLHIAANAAYLGWSLFRPGRFRPTARGVWHGIKGIPQSLASRRQYAARSTAFPLLVWNPLRVLSRRNKFER